MACIQLTAEAGRGVFASRAFLAGDLLHESVAFAAVPGDNAAVCSHCLGGWNEGAPHMSCTRCGAAQWCSNACLAAHESVHTAGGECEALIRFGRLSIEGGTAAMRLLIRIAATRAAANAGATNDEDCNSNTDDNRSSSDGGGGSSGGEERQRAPPLDSAIPAGYDGVSALESHVDDVPKELKSAVRQVAEAIGDTLPARARLSARRLTRLFFAVQSNAHAVCDERRAVRGLGLFVSGSMLNHSCQPNCHHYFATGEPGVPPRLVFRALAGISAGEQLCYSYVDRYRGTAARRAALAAAYTFHCRCDRCRACDKAHAAAGAANGGGGGGRGGEAGSFAHAADAAGGGDAGDARASAAGGMSGDCKSISSEAAMALDDAVEGLLCGGDGSSRDGNGCEGAMAVAKDAAANGSEGAALVCAETARCCRCGRVEDAAVFAERYRDAAGGAERVLAFAASALATSDRGEQLEEARRALWACLAPPSTPQLPPSSSTTPAAAAAPAPPPLLHPRHYLLYRARLMLASVCKRLAELKPAAAAPAAAAVATTVETTAAPVTMSPLLVWEAATALWGAKLLVEDFVGGNSPELADLNEQLGRALESFAAAAAAQRARGSPAAASPPPVAFVDGVPTLYKVEGSEEEAAGTTAAAAMRRASTALASQPAEPPSLQACLRTAETMFAVCYGQECADRQRQRH